MEQLSGLDTSFLNTETATVHNHVGWLAVFDQRESSITLDGVKTLITERLHELAPFRRRLLTVPFGLDRPYWLEDGEFDLDFHVRNIAVPPPGDDAQLANLVARLHSRKLDRSRPLWELYVIEGLAGGDAVAQYTKIHHACVDGITGSEVAGTLLDILPEGRDAAGQVIPWSPDREPGTGEMLTRGLMALATQPALQVRLQRRLWSAGWQSGRHQIGPQLATMQEALRRTPGIAGLIPTPDDAEDGETEFLSRPSATAPRLSFNRSVSSHRRLAFGEISLDDVKEIKNHFGYTVNDVVMAVCAGALRSWLQLRQELPTDPVQAMVPVSVRPKGDRASGNQMSAMVAPLPTNEPDPLERLHLAHRAMEVAKTDHAALPADLLQDFGRFAPPAVAARAARLVARTKLADMANPVYNLVISNIPGPRHPLYSSGARQLASYPVATINDGSGLNITLSSYDGALNFGILSCRDAVDDLWSLMRAIEISSEELLAATRADADTAPALADEPAKKKPAAKKSAAKRPTAKKPTAKKPTKRPAAAKKKAATKKQQKKSAAATKSTKKQPTKKSAESASSTKTTATKKASS